MKESKIKIPCDVMEVLCHSDHEELIEKIMEMEKIGLALETERDLLIEQLECKRLMDPTTRLSRTVPERPGWYWYRAKFMDGKPIITQVFYHQDEEKLCATFKLLAGNTPSSGPYYDFYIPCEDLHNDFWSERLPYPEDNNA